MRHVDHAVCVRQHSRHQTGPGRSANRGLAMRVGEEHASGRQTIDVWSFCLRMAAQAAGPVVEIVDGDEEHISLFVSGKPDSDRAKQHREYRPQRWLFVNQQIDQLTAHRKELLKTSQRPSVAQVRQLMRLKGIGINSAWLFVMEFFSWRDFRNRREVGACAGLTNAPYQSGDTSRDQGIEKAGNRFIRAVAIEIAWSWLRYQPDSQLSQWYQRRFGQGSKRQRKIGIVALARKLLIALWRYLETGTVPEGALLKAA